MGKGIYINDSIHGLIWLSDYERKIISSIGFNRLHDVYQNSTVYLTFPTNRTKRFEHSLGTMKLCSDMLYHATLNTNEKIIDKFYKIFESEINNIIKEIRHNTSICDQMLGGLSPKGIPTIKFNNFINSITPYNIPEKYKHIHVILMQSVRAAALLHDIGHPPFSHIVEYALRDVYTTILSKQPVSHNQTINDFQIKMSPYFEEKKKLHEQMGDEITESILKEIVHSIDEEDEQYDENLFELVIMKCVIKIFKEEGNFIYLHSIIDSSLDGDRLDYVTRDSVNSGLNFGIIDYKRIINDMQILFDDEKILFCIPVKAINSVEDFIKRRYNVYKDIIYHHRVIKTDYLLKSIVKTLVLNFLTEDKGDNLDEKAVIPFDISGLWFPLGTAASKEKANALSQWNDSWLMTILRQIYYTEYYRNKDIRNNNNKLLLSQQLSELLRNKKYYYSLIKRSEDFKLIDDKIKHVLFTNKNKIIEKINHIKNTLLNDNIIGSIETINNILDYANNEQKGFLLSYLSRHSISFDVNADIENEILKNIIIKTIQEDLLETKIVDIVVVFKKISIGLDEPIYFYNNSDKILSLREISGIFEILKLDSDYAPLFYIYLLINENGEIIKNKKEKLLNNIGEKIGHVILSQITDKLQAIIDLIEAN